MPPISARRPRATADCEQRVADLLAYIKDAEQAELPTSLLGLSAEQKTLLAQGRALFGDDAAQRDAWGVGHQPEDAMDASTHRTIPVVLRLRAEDLPGTVSKVTHAMIDAEHHVGPALLEELERSLLSSSLQHACSTAADLAQVVGGASCRSSRLPVCRAIRACCPRPTRRLTWPAALCRAYVFELVHKLSVVKTAAALTASYDPARGGPTLEALLTALSRQYQLAMDGIGATYDQLWQRPDVVLHERDVTAETTQSGEFTELHLNASPFSVHLVTFE